MTTGFGAEEWRAVPIERFAELYEVSSLGRVRSLHARHRIPKVLAAKIDGDGYREVCLCRDSKPHTLPIRRLVALAFHGDKRNVLHREIAHLDGSRTNDRADNLQWVSHAENSSHKRAHGTLQVGEKHPRAKLTEANVIAIRHASQPYATLARRYGVSWHTISDIRRGRLWKHLLPQVDQG